MEKKSKVAICSKCNGLIKACHVNYLSKSSEKEFTQLSNEGFVVLLETTEKTQSRQMVSYQSHLKGNCS